ncbi:MAG: hypothetical protein GY759_21465, partial [Chloroflexi bacterium]|nr:hypothetical protein [Chloroflexota bacterium]
HCLIISKALYRLRSSGLRCSERFPDVLRQMGFFPSRAEKDIRMQDKGDHYEYIAVYVDNLLIVSKDPQAIYILPHGMRLLPGQGRSALLRAEEVHPEDDGQLHPYLRREAKARFLTPRQGGPPRNGHIRPAGDRRHPTLPITHRRTTMGDPDWTLRRCYSRHDNVPISRCTTSWTHGTRQTHPWVHLEDARRGTPRSNGRARLLEHPRTTLRLGVHMLRRSQGGETP